jgi:hypothetical protein
MTKGLKTGEMNLELVADDDNPSLRPFFCSPPFALNVRVVGQNGCRCFSYTQANSHKEKTRMFWAVRAFVLPCSEPKLMRL